MGILETIKGLGFVSRRRFQEELNEAIKRELDKIPDWARETADSDRWTVPDPYIYATQSDMYRLSPILGTALDILADDVGLSQFNVKRIVGEEEKDIPNHPFEALLRSPNPLDSGLEFLRDTTITYKLNGNSVWWLNRSNYNDIPTEMWTIPFERVTPVPDGKMYLSHYEYLAPGKDPIKLPVWQIVHFKTYNPKNRFVGLSPIESLAVTLVGDLGMRKTNTRTYTEYGGSPQSILAFKEFINNETWDKIKEDKQKASMKNEMMMLRGVGDGVSWMSRAMSSKDMEFIEILKHNMEDVFNRMAPGLLAMLDKNSTEANALAARATYSEKSLWKTLETIAQKVTAEILPAYGRKLKGEFDDPRVVDRKMELEEQTAFERVHTIDEVRVEKYGDDPIGDERGKMLVGEARTRFEARPQQTSQRQEQPQQFEEQPEQTDASDATAKLAIEDLQKWRRIALKGKDKMTAFKSTYIPKQMSADIIRKLPLLTEKSDIASMFDTKIESMKAKPSVDPLVLLQGIEAGVKALELKKG